MPLAEDIDLRELARTTHGFVGADLAALAREAAIEAVRRIMPRLDFERQTIPVEVLDSLRVPMRNPDFAPFLQKVRDLKPDAVYVFVPSGAGAALMKQFAERGMDKAGIKLIGTGDITDDDILNSMGDVANGVVTSHHYSASHNSAINKKFVAAFEKANNGLRPNFMAVGGYDGMRVIYEAAKASKGAGGEALLDAMKGQVFESPRGPMFIDAQTRDVVHNIYIRKVEKVGGQLFNQEFATIKDVKDPGKSR
jgi:branched-chain amino acid transport system substrate-binding protein